jgi:hypothetical protein
LFFRSIEKLPWVRHVDFAPPIELRPPGVFGCRIWPYDKQQAHLVAPGGGYKPMAAMKISLKPGMAGQFSWQGQRKPTFIQGEQAWQL